MDIPIPILLLLFLLPLAAAQSPEQVHPSCGALLRDLAYHCGQPDRALVDRCCASIRAFNDAYCFCQAPAFQPAAQLATNSYAFSARMAACNVTTPYARPVPSRDFAGRPDTCPHPPGVSPAAPDTLGERGFHNQRCAHPRALRERRERALDAFDALSLDTRSTAQVDAFRAVVRRLFVERAGLTSVGLTALRGRELVEDFLLARMVGLFPWSAKRRTDVVWPSPGQVNYAADLGEFRVRYTFASFDPCSDKILSVFIVERDVMSAFGSQFYYPDLTQDALTEYDVTPLQFCQRVSGACGELSPYRSEAECVNFVQGLKEDEKVLCNKFDNDAVSMIALLGDTIACRYQYLLMAMTNPNMYCPLVGMEGKEYCEERLCLENYYGDMFGASGQRRYESSNGFTCSGETGTCTELWPDEDALSTAV